MAAPPIAPYEPVAERPPVRGPECPHCGTAALPGQEYCLECGSRLPSTAGVEELSVGRTRALRAREGWAWPSLVALVVAALATVGVLALRAAADDPEPFFIEATTDPGAAVTQTATVPALAPEPLPAPTATAPRIPPATTPVPQPPPSRPTLTVWPEGRTGHTVVLASVPERGGRQASMAKAREARADGLPQVGVLRSARFASLHPGYLVVFSGVYNSMPQATRAAARAQEAGYDSAYARLIAP